MNLIKLLLKIDNATYKIVFNHSNLSKVVMLQILLGVTGSEREEMTIK